MRLPVFRSEDTRSRGTHFRRLVVQARAWLKLPAAVRRFYLRALWTAWRQKDQYSFDVVTRPYDLVEILRLAGDAEVVVELGTATAWTTIAFALARPGRRVITYDPVVREERRMYLGLIPPAVRERLTFVKDIGRTGPRTDEPIGFLFVDGSHQREDTVLTFQAWSDAIAPGGAIAFHDYLDPHYPGVTEAIRELDLPGEQRARLFIWRRPDSERSPASASEALSAEG
ncbi:MAG: class I SAM-dependent methyltransferase [Solirubrobacteraceae bacterium]